MRNRLLQLSCFLALLALVPAVQAQMMPERTRLLVAARFAELEQLSEKEVANDPNPNTPKLSHLCIAYGKVKRYDKLFPCLKRLEANVARGDHAVMDLDEMRRSSPFLFGLAMAGSGLVGGAEGLAGDVRPSINLIYSEAYAELRDYDRAIDYAQKASDSIPKQWNQERYFRIQALTALGLAHAFAGKREEATRYGEALQAVSTSYPFSGLTNDKVTGVAKIYIALGDYQKAYDGLRSDTEGFGKIFLVLGDALGGALSGMGGESLFTWQQMPKQFMAVKTELEIGKIREAREGYDKLLAIPRVRDNGEIYWVLLHDRGRIAASEGNLAAAVDYWKRAVDVIELQRSTINTEANKIGFVGDKQAVYRRLVDGLFTLGRLPEAFDFLERSKSRALVDMLASKTDFAAASVDSAKIQELLQSASSAELEARAQDIAAAQARAQDGTNPATSTRAAPAQQAIAEAAPELASLVSVTSTPLRELQDKLPADEALVEYYYDDKSLFIFVLTSQALLGTRTEVLTLEADARKLRDMLDGSDSPAYLPVAQSLYRKLIGPLDALVPDKAKLAIVPHGVLHYLPFAALQDGERFTIDRRSLRFLPSASVLRYLRPGGQKPDAAGILALGNPDLGNPKFDLQFAEKEAQTVVQTVPRSRALVRGEATEAAFRQYAGGFSYVHFATHGQFNADAPLKSALLLSKDGSSDGRLTVDKLYSMRLNADLATLSACETGLGKVANGDDVVGLTRGFLYAGASTVVSSLWKVDDKATASLMTRFYTGLKGKDKREALRQAQIAVRERFPHPFYWAAFQLTGRAD